MGSQEQDENPKQAMQGWDNESSSLQAAGAVDWGNSFCTAHHVGTWCSGFTQVPCCRASCGFVRCGSTVHSRRCGWHVSGWHAAGWHYDQENKTTYLEEPSREQDENPKQAMQGWGNESLRCRLQVQLIIGVIPSAQLTTLALGAVASRRCDAAELRG